MADSDSVQFKRCAIYTRKSTSHMLNRELNSLKTQREICEAFITTQFDKGWRPLPKRYDDPAKSGANANRPALNELLQDIERGRIDIVVIYKIDRLTRSLADFIRMIEIFDRHGATFVSVSQSFDTSDSMGRMILNILLAFAQFERELIADRVRDSVRNKKRHGIWSGGPPPYGYVLTKKGLVVLESEARNVRFIFERFLELKSFTRLSAEVEALGLISEVKANKNGSVHGGRPITGGSVYLILRNPIYIGQIRGHDRNYPGRHEAIISEDVWQSVQDLRRVRSEYYHRKLNPSVNFLNGILRDCYGRKMYTITSGKIQLRYVSVATSWGISEGIKPLRARAEKIERLVIASVQELILNRAKLRAALIELGTSNDEIHKLAFNRGKAAECLGTAPTDILMTIMPALVERVSVFYDKIELTVRSLELRRFLECSGSPDFQPEPSAWPWSHARYELTVPICGLIADRAVVIDVEARQVGANAPKRELVSLITQSRKARSLVDAWRDLPLRDIALKMECKPPLFSRLLRLNYLAPDIIAAILDGRQPDHVDKEFLLGTEFPLDWALQRQLFGFPKPIAQGGQLAPSAPCRRSKTSRTASNIVSGSDRG